MSKQRKKKRGDKNPIRLFPDGHDLIKRERDNIFDTKLPSVRAALQQASEDKKAELEREKEFLLRRALLLGQWLNNCEIIKPTTLIDLSKVSTAELHAELAKREGVREMMLSVDNEYKISDKVGMVTVIEGPARVIINQD